MSKKWWILLAALIAMAAAAAKKAKGGGAAEWHGLTESEARTKLDAKLPSKIPADKRLAISDKVVAKMRDRGVISEDDATSDVTDDAQQLADH